MTKYHHPDPTAPGFPNIFEGIPELTRTKTLVHWLIHWAEIEYAADPIMHTGAKEFLTSLLKKAEKLKDNQTLPEIKAGGLYKTRIDIPATKDTPAISFSFGDDLNYYIEFLPILEKIQKNRINRLGAKNSILEDIIRLFKYTQHSKDHRELVAWPSAKYKTD